MTLVILAAAATLVLADVSRASEKREIRLDTHQFQFSPYVVIDPKDGTVRLARSTLVTDEMGATDHHQTEPLSERVWARKFFELSRDAIREPELFIFGRPKQVLVNEKLVDKLEPLISTGWTRVKVPPEHFDKLPALVVMRGGGQLLFEPGRQMWARGPRHSERSSDAGKKWSINLGAHEHQQGEYLVRLRLRSLGPGGHPDGWTKSHVFDLWAVHPGDIAIPTKVTALRGFTKLWKEQPERTNLMPFVRTGSTPTPDDKTWTSWGFLLQDQKPTAAVASHRWAQLKFELASGDVQTTPSLRRYLTLTFDHQPDAVADAVKLEVIRPKEQPPIAMSSVPFLFQAPSPRLKLLRDRYKLDEVIAPGKTEMEQLTLLRWWVRNQWHTAWQGGAASWMPPWDAHIILECKDQSDCLTMCTHYAAVFTQCCLALGWNARYCILDHHCVSEVFVNQHNKWVMMDAGNSKERADVGLHFERSGLPLSALELHLAYHRKKTDGITVHFTPKALAEKIASLCRPEPMAAKEARPEVIALANLKKYPVCQLENYRRYAFPGRNNYLDSLLPGELYQGWSEYFYDGYWWVGDSPDDPKLSPEYSKHLDPARPQDIDWSLNWTRIHLARTAKAGELQVDLETLTPNFARFEMFADGQWKPTPARFTWPVKAGENTLRVRSVNQFGKPGIEASVQVKRGE